jgi:hypothetical protein
MNNTLRRIAVLVGCVLMVAFVATVALAQHKPAATPAATIAKVVVKSDGKVIPLKREEQIAFMFVEAINSLEDDCGREAAEPCTMEALVRGPKPKGSWGIGKLKFDPNATDSNYTYKVTLSGSNWEIRADPRKPGLGGFYAKGRFGGKWYNPAGPAAESNMKIEEFGIGGDSFVAR